jgi:glycopeptide antibiotics resistance protein
MTSTAHKTIIWAALGLVLVALAVIALGHSGPVEQARVRLLPFQAFPGAVACVVRRCPGAAASWRFLIINGLGNIVVFMPLGMILYVALKRQAPALNRPVLYVILFGALVSLIFEIIQLWIPGRVTEPDDVVLNAAGALLGSLTIRWGETILSRTK